LPIKDWPTKPTAEQAARRAFTLAAMTCRSGIEQNAGNAEAEAFRAEVLRWLGTVGVTSTLEPQELEILQAPLGTLTQRQEMSAGWRAEGLGVLAWALNRWELAPFDAPTDAPAVAEALGFMEPEGLDLLKAAKLRTLSELEEMAGQMYLLHVRLRQAYEGSGSKNAAQLAKDLGIDVTNLDLVENDLVVGDVRLTSAPKDLVRMTISTVVERHRAANWLLGENPVYSEVSYSRLGAR
jgi:hypothetical protein